MSGLRAKTGPGLARRCVAPVLAVVLSLGSPLAARADEALLSGPDDPGFEESLEQVGDPDDAGSLAPVGEEPDGARLASALDSYLAENAPLTGVPGIAVAVVDPDGVRYEATIGDCADRHATFIVGSLSKSMTAAAVVRLEEEGRIDLDAPAAAYVGDLAPDGVTVRSLLNQTSGFGYYETLAGAAVGESAGYFSYANANYDLLGRVVEAASGQSLESYLEEEVFAPTGMDDASAGDDEPTEPGHRSWFGVPVVDGFEHATSDDDAWGSTASGYVRASVADMESYLRMYLNSGEAEDGSELISPEGVHQMVFSRVPDPGGDTWYGMGWTTYSWGDGELVMSHDGQVENYVARMCVIPGRNLGIVVMGDANDEFGGNEAFFSLADDVVSIAVGASPSGVDGSARVWSHVRYDALYLLLVAACAVLLARAGRWRGNAAPAVWLYLAAPVLLLAVPPLETGMRWRDFAAFYPDQALVLAVCCLLLFAGGAARLAPRLRGLLRAPGASRGGRATSAARCRRRLPRRRGRA